MAETVGQHSVAAFTSPVNGTTPIDANTVRGNDNTVRVAYVDHDADPGIHVQSSSLASRPVAGTVGRKWITVSSGRYQLWYDDGARWHEVASDAVNVDCLADANLTKGDVVKITGFNNGQNLPTVNKVSASTDTAFGIVENTVTSGNIVQIVNTGLIEDVDTNGYAVGTILYPNTSGGWTSTKPTSGNYQPAGYVLRGNTNTGVLYVEFSAPRIVERSDNTASTVVLRDASGNFSAGTITAGALTSTGLVTFASLKGTGATTVTNILDEDNMASDSATALATQQSIKAYVDAKVATVDTLAEVLANGNTTGANDIIVSSGQKIRTPAITAGDGTASATIANSTGVMTIGSSVLTTTDINGGTIDGTTIGGASAAAGTFTTVAGTTGNITTVNATTVDTTNIEVTNVKAKDGTAAVTIADSTGKLTVTAAPILSALTASQAVFTDASKNLVSNAITGTGNVVMSASPTLTGTVTAATLNATTLGGTLSTAAQPNVTSVGTLTSLTVSGVTTLSAGTAAAPALTTSGDTNNGIFFPAADVTAITTAGTERLRVDSSGNVGIGTASPSSFGFLATLSGATAKTAWFDTTAATAYSAGSNFANAIVTLRTGANATGNATGIRFASSANGSLEGLFAYVQNASTYGDFVWQGFNGTYNERMRLDSSGNLGLGVTPSAWSGATALQVRNSLSLWSQASGSARYANNVFFDGSVRKYIFTGTAAEYEQGGASHAWKIAASGTAGNNITFTTAMTLDASGNLLVGKTSASYSGANRGLLELNGTNEAWLLLQRNATAITSGIVRQTSTGMELVNRENTPLILYTNDTERARITSSGNFQIGTAAIATTATDGFLYIPTCAGAPTGTPTTITGLSPLVVDSTNNRFYVYVGGAWKYASLT